jgi:hypothetical protein
LARLDAGSDEWVTIATGIWAIRAIGVKSEVELDGERKMIKIVFFLRRLSRLTHEEFLRYWYETHAPLVRKHQQVLRIVRYVQFHSELGALSNRMRAFRNSPEPFDGIAEKRLFVDLTRSPICVGLEKEIFSG